LNRITLYRWFEPFWKVVPYAIPECFADHEVLVVDAIHIERSSVILIARTLVQKDCFWFICGSENYQNWAMFLNNLPQPFAIVCDGHKGLLKAIGDDLPGVILQRCIAHIVRRGHLLLTQQPKTICAQELKKIFYDLSKVQTQQDQKQWIYSFHQWTLTYQSFLSEKSYAEQPSKNWWYTHKRLRSLRSLLKHSLPDLFRYLQYDHIPRTSNHVEGGLNARIRELIRRHRGLSLHQQIVLITTFLYSKKPTQNVT
jgi:hypothetical protein